MGSDGPELLLPISLPISGPKLSLARLILAFFFTFFSTSAIFFA